MTKQIAYFLLFSSVIFLTVDFILDGFEFDKGRIFRSLSGICIIVLSIFNLRKINKGPSQK
jgi:hypothetical protein